MNQDILWLKLFAGDLFWDLEDITLFTEKFYLFDLIKQFVSSLRVLSVLSPSSFELFNYTIKTFTLTTSRQRGSIFEGAMRVLNVSFWNEESWTEIRTALCKTNLVRERRVLKLGQISMSALSSLAFIDKNWRDVLALQFEGLNQEFLRSAGYRFLFFWVSHDNLQVRTHSWWSGCYSG